MLKPRTLARRYQEAADDRKLMSGKYLLQTSMKELIYREKPFRCLPLPSGKDML